MITIRQNRTHAKAIVYGKIKDQLFNLNKLEFANPDLFQSLKDEFSKEWLREKGRGHYLFMFFSLYEEIFTQYKKFNLIDKEEYDSWNRRLRKHLSNRQAVLGYWNECYSKEAPSEFKSHVTSLIRDLGM
jgi:hypothetical protein